MLHLNYNAQNPHKISSDRINILALREKNSELLTARIKRPQRNDLSNCFTLLFKLNVLSPTGALRPRNFTIHRKLKLPCRLYKYK